jgi:proline dehydrogenase
VGAIDRIVSAALPAVPGFLVRSVGRRYVAGEGLDDALATVRDLRSGGLLATVDVLGEEVREPAAADRAVREYMRLARALAGTDATISIKPTLMGLRIGEDLARENLDRVFSAAARGSVLVQLDMEDHTTTDATLRLFHAMRGEHGNAGAVLQARLHRTWDDVRSLAEAGAAIRLCKGIYPENEAIAFRDPDEIRASYVRSLEALLGAGSYAGIATHDDALVDAARDLVERLGIPAGGYEFQMLLGVRPELGRALVTEGRTVRIYVPYGADWEAYCVRRLRESPEIAGHVLGALLGGQ